ncbi:unnamed protein product [Phytomonas sp. Hart1]|nr:unnamed protein product [Phytomonas sp. Hart1]|eukprot:CCW71570.1 unnamed protein product [Phytomonas sp. isolate Hart1]
MANHGWRKAAYAGGPSPPGSSPSRLAFNQAEHRRPSGAWAPLPEYFNEGGFGPDGVGARALKLVRGDFVAPQLAPSRAEQFPVSKMDGFLANPAKQRPSRASSEPRPLPHVGSVYSPWSSSGGSREAANRAASPGPSSSSGFSIASVRCERLPYLLSVRQLLAERGLGGGDGTLSTLSSSGIALEDWGGGAALAGD